MGVACRALPLLALSCYRELERCSSACVVATLPFFSLAASLPGCFCGASFVSFLFQSDNSRVSSALYVNNRNDHGITNGGIAILGRRSFHLNGNCAPGGRGLDNRNYHPED